MLGNPEVSSQGGEKEGVSELGRWPGSQILMDGSLLLGQELGGPPEPRHRVVAGGGRGVVRAGVIPRLGRVIPTARTVIARAGGAIASIRSAIASVRGAITGVRGAIASVRSAIATADSPAIGGAASAMAAHGTENVVKQRDPEQRLQHWNQR